MAKYDYLIVGAGLYGACFSYIATQKGKKCLIIEKRPHVGGNLYCENIEGINVHKYGAHIFHTSNKDVWNFVTSLVEFNNYVNSPIANYKGKLYNLPFNMNTFHALWGVTTPEEASRMIRMQMEESGITKPSNLEEQAISLVGKDIYKILIKGYTEKQWGRKCNELPASIIKRLPVRFTFDNNYFNDTYQGIPIGGYNKLFDKLLSGAEVLTDTDFFSDRDYFKSLANKIVFTGPIDQYFNYIFGKLEYRTVRFENEILNIKNYQGVAVMNYTDSDTPYTRIIEHKHFEFGQQEKTVISKEYSSEWKENSEPYYPINNNRNNSLYLKYKELADNEENIIFGGRLSEYKYYDMHHIVEQVIKYADSI
ncbi:MULTISPECIES: UDP-galactopyranose mutase [Bacteroides]|uniref:UDP-galactopyranose mutase n=1 Tax=Bacteroides TaxID=816 RepID=UPI00242C688F|nr:MULTISPECIES: UDP-galactopyranose mutase [Bacteroides]